jgi:hypothetical protein
MTDFRWMQTSFNAGELSPAMAGRVDQDKYFSGTEVQFNFLPLLQGPTTRRGGTRDIGPAKSGTGGKGPLIDFVFNTEQSYVLEFGDLYVRFWADRGLLLDGGLPYEVVTPYAEADLLTSEGTFALRTSQSGDVMRIVHAEGKYPVYLLSRIGATNWTVAREETIGGPFRDINVDDAVTVQASAATGAGVTLTASSSIFQAGHVGSLILMESPDPGLIKPYQSSESIAINDQQRNGGNVYIALDNFTWVDGDDTQRYVPVHVEGTANDGKVRWTYRHSGYGWAKITGFTSGTVVTATVLSRLPDAVVSAATRRWAFSEFSSVYGWPTDITFFKERLVYSRGRYLFLSVVGAYDDFSSRDAGILTKETAMKLQITTDRFDGVRWMGSLRSLLLGSASAETSVQEQTTQEIFAADNVQNVPQTEYGARKLKPLKVGDAFLFCERAGGRVRDTRYSFEIDRYKSEEVSVLAEHIFERLVLGQPTRDVVDWAYQRQRDSNVWVVLSDGTLAVLTLNRERGVVAWTRHELGGDAFVEAVQCIPSPDGQTDDVWFMVRRTVNGATQRRMEILLDHRLALNGEGEGVFVDSSVTQRNATPFTVVTGLSHLEGETVQVCLNGSKHPDRVVSAGQITLDWEGTLAHVGYQYRSRLKPMRMEIQGRGGTSQTAKKGIAELHLRVQNTVGGRVGPTFDKMDPVKTLNANAPVGTPPTLFTGDIKVQFPGGFTDDGYLCYEQADPLPATIVAVIAAVKVND